jgi:molybdopterin/thiamine biosynthesis adenylyltransferase
MSAWGIMLSNEQIERYSRQIILPQVGGRGQERLLGAAVAIVGADAMGCAAALYLAGAGVGKLTIIDDRRIKCSDAIAGVLHGRGDVGRNRAAAAVAELDGLNPDCRITAVATPVSAAPARTVARDHDSVIDACGIPEVSLSLNAACLSHRKPLIWGSVTGTLGALAIFAGPWPHASCYHCYRDSPRSTPTTDDSAGAVGALAAVFIGALQAAEAIKIILGIETIVAGGLLLCNAEDMTVREVTPSRNPHCQSCGAESLR